MLRNKLHGKTHLPARRTESTGQKKADRVWHSASPACHTAGYHTEHVLIQEAQGSTGKGNFETEKFNPSEQMRTQGPKEGKLSIFNHRPRRARKPSIAKGWFLPSSDWKTKLHHLQIMFSHAFYSLSFWGINNTIAKIDTSYLFKGKLSVWMLKASLKTKEKHEIYCRLVFISLDKAQEAVFLRGSHWVHYSHCHLTL